MPRRLPAAHLIAPLLMLGGLGACATPAPIGASAPAVAPQAAGAVSGVVARLAGDRFVPVAGARVIAPDGAQAVTDEAGRYTLSQLGAGETTLRIEAAGFKPASRDVRLGPGQALPRVNVALAPAGYAVQQAVPLVTVTGVITDPRGAALANANVQITCAGALGGTGTRLNLQSDADGFYAAGLANVVPGAGGPADIAVSANGTSPGGVALTTSVAAHAPAGDATVVLNGKADSFAGLPNPSSSGDTLVPAGEEAAIQVNGVSTRVDEFYVRLTSGGQSFDVLPIAVASGRVTFRVPVGMPDAAFTAAVVPFGLTGKISPASPQYLSVDYRQANFDADVSYAANSDLTDATVATGAINSALFVGGDQARYTLTIANASTLLGHDLTLKGTVPAGTNIASVKANGTAIAGADITQPNITTGAFQVQNIHVNATAQTQVEIIFTSPPKLANGTSYRVTGLSLSKPSLNLTKTVPPADSPALMAKNIDPVALAITKSFLDDGTPGNGQAKVQLVVSAPGAGATGLFKITDVVRTEGQSFGATGVPSASITATSAFIRGTATMPPSGTTLGLVANEKLMLRIDGGTSYTINVPSNSTDAENLIAFIGLATSSNVTAFRTSDNKLFLERSTQGAGRTLEVLSTTSPNVLTKLGLTAGVVVSSGYTADFTGATATQPGGTVWTVTSSSSSWAIAGTITSVFTIKPPASFVGADTFTSPITITYPVKKLNGTAGVLGGPGTGYGPKITAVNLVSPYTDTTRDQALTTTGTEPALFSNY